MAPQNDTVATGDIQQESIRILEKAQTDPESAGKELTNLINNATTAAQKKAAEDIQKTLQPAIENNIYAAEVKSKNKDIVDFFGETSLAIEVADLMQRGKQFREAVDTVVKNYKQKYDSLKANTPTPPPAGATGETGANQIPHTPPPAKIITQEDEMKARKAKRMAQGLA
jgi:hypothetical protein